MLFAWQIAPAAELKDCVQTASAADGSASLSNVCSIRLNVTYCIDSATSAVSCSKQPYTVLTLGPGDTHRLATYRSEGEGSVYQAVCAYPEAAIQWTPAPGASFQCKKTCVMC